MEKFDPDALALASMIADSLRGIPIDVAELPPTAHRLVAAYVAHHDFGTVGFTASRRAYGVRLRFTARDQNGTALPDVPVIDRHAGRTIDVQARTTEIDSATRPPQC